MKDTLLLRQGDIYVKSGSRFKADAHISPFDTDDISHTFICLSFEDVIHHPGGSPQPPLHLFVAGLCDFLNMLLNLELWSAKNMF